MSHKLIEKTHIIIKVINCQSFYSRCSLPFHSGPPLYTQIYISQWIPLDKFSVLTLHDLWQGKLASLLVLVGIEQVFSDRIDQQFTLVNEYDLDWLIIQPEYHGMLRPEPSSDVDQLFLINIPLFHSQLVLTFSLKIPLKMIKQTHFFLQLIRIVLKVIFFDDILPLDPLNIVKEILTVGHFGRIVEVYPYHVVTESISNTIFWWVIDPFLDCYVRCLHLTN